MYPGSSRSLPSDAGFELSPGAGSERLRDWDHRSLRLATRPSRFEGQTDLPPEPERHGAPAAGQLNYLAPVQCCSGWLAHDYVVGAARLRSLEIIFESSGSHQIAKK